MNDSFDQIDNYLDAVGSLLYSLPRQAILDIAHAIQTTYQYDRTIYILGLAGSASTAAHFGAELQRRAGMLKRPIQVHVLTDQHPHAARRGRDHASRATFARQLVRLIKPGDMVIAINGSTWPRSLTRLLADVGTQGAVTVGFTGNAGSNLLRLVDHCVVVPGTQVDHLAIMHLTLCNLIGDVVQTVCSHVEQAAPEVFATSRSYQARFGIP